MLEQRGVHHLVAELAKILEADVILFDAKGTVIAHAGAEREGSERVIWVKLATAEGDVGPLGILEDDRDRDRVHVRAASPSTGSSRECSRRHTSGASAGEFIDTALSF